MTTPLWGSRTRAGSLNSGNRRVGMIPTCRCGSLYLIFRQVLGLVLLMDRGSATKDV